MLQHNNKIDPRHFHADPDNKNKVNKAAPDPTPPCEIWSEMLYLSVFQLG